MVRAFLIEKITTRTGRVVPRRTYLGEDARLPKYSPDFRREIRSSLNSLGSRMEGTTLHSFLKGETITMGANRTATLELEVIKNVVVR